MIIRLLRCVLVVSLLLGMSSTAQATLISVDPDSHSAMTDISNLYPGVTLSAVGTDVGTASVFAVGSSIASTGANIFGNDIWDRWVVSAYELRADFDTPTDFVSIDIINFSTSGGTHGYLNAYDGVGNLVASTDIFVAEGIGNVGPISINAPGADIAYVMAGGSHEDAVLLDNLQYNDAAPVPEPATVLLLGTGLVGLMGFRKKFKK